MRYSGDSIFILDKSDQVIALLSNSLPSSTPYWDDEHHEILENGYETFEFKTLLKHPTGVPDLIREENKILIRDMDGISHIFRIRRVKENTITKEKNVFAETEAVELLNDPVRPMNISGTPSIILGAILQPSRWKAGIVETGAINTLNVEEYSSVLAQLHETARMFNLEIRFRIEFTNRRITGRFVDLLQRRGNPRGGFFEYSQDIKGLTRTKDTTELATALIGVGRSDQNENVMTFKNVIWNRSSGHPADKPGGQDWIGDPAALQQFGVEGRHIFRVYTSDQTDPSRLLAETWDELQRRIKGAVEYEVDLLVLERLAGYEHKAVRIGDTIIIKDTSFTTPLVLEARVLELKRSRSNPANDSITLGEYREREVKEIELIRQLQSELARKAAQWESGFDVTESDVAPLNPYDNQYWLDTSKEPNIWMRYSAALGRWVPGTPSDATQIDYKDGLPLEHYKPAQPGADVTGDNVSKDTGHVGGLPSETVKDNINKIIYEVGNGTFETVDGALVKAGPISPTAPFDPQPGQKWIDTSNPDIEVWKRWDGTAKKWVEIGRVSFDQLTGLVKGNQIGIGAVGEQQLADLAVTLQKMANHSVDVNKIVDNAISEGKIQSEAVTTVKIANNAVDVNKIVDNAISSAKIQTDAITEIKINAGAITTTKILDGAIANAKIAANAVTDAKIATGAVTTTKLVDDAIIATKIAANAITTAKIGTGQITATQILDRTIGRVDVALAGIQGENVSERTLAAGKIIANSITGGEIAANTITGDQIAANAITAAKIASSTITATQIASNAITAVKVAANAITTDKLVANAVTAAKIAAGTITANEISSGAITADKIAANAITADKIATGAIVIGPSSNYADGYNPATNLQTAQSYADTTAEQVKSYVQSRGENLVTNGTGLLGDNTNFKSFTFDGSQVFAGGGSFFTDRQNGTLFNDEFIPVDPSRLYRFGLMAKSALAIGHNYFGIVSYDIDRLSIQPYHVYGSAFRTVELTKDLKAGDTVIHVSDVSQFKDNQTTPDHTHSIIFYGYKNSFGYEYPVGTYSRDVFTIAWDKGAIDRVNNTITLNKPFNLTNKWDAQGIFRAGHKVAPTQSGSSYQYMTASNVKVPTDWTWYEGLIRGNGIASNAFPHGTGYIKLMFLTNRSSSGGQAGDSLWINSLEFTDITSINTAEKNANNFAETQFGTARDRVKLWERTGTTYIDGGQIFTDSVTANQIAAGAITASEIAANAVTADAINANAVTTAKIATNAVTANEIAANTITASNIASKTITGDRLVASTITATEIAGKTITAAQIAATTITANEIATNAVTADKIAANAVKAGKIDAYAITAQNIVGYTITAQQMALATLTGDNIKAQTVTGNALAFNTITADKIAAKSITADKIAAGTITADLISTAGLSADVIKSGTIGANTVFAGTLQAAKGTFTGTVQIGDFYTTTGMITVTGSGVESDKITIVSSNQLYRNRVKMSAGVLEFIYDDQNLYLNGKISSTFEMRSSGLNFEGDVFTVNGVLVALQRVSIGDVYVYTGLDVTGNFRVNAPGTYYNTQTFNGEASFKGTTYWHGSEYKYGYEYDYSSYEPVTNRNESGYCGVAGYPTAGTYNAVGGVGVNFRKRRAYQPSSIGLTTNTYYGGGVSYTDLTTDGFWLYINGNGTTQYQYWRGYYRVY